MIRRSKFLILSLAAGALFAQKKGAEFRVPPLAEFEYKQTGEDVTVAVKAYDTAELCQQAFGKLNPNQYEVLPVLVVIENKRSSAIRVDSIQTEYIIPGVGKIENSTVAELLGVVSPSKPNLGPNPLPFPRKKVKDNPFNRPEVEMRAWVAKVIPPGESASGFLYFQTRHRPSARFYLTGIYEPATAKALFYFEIPFSK